jgi:transcriptional regulator with XRE-family HTH domain
MDDQRFGTAIRTLRIRRGWRQTDLAAQSGISKSSISRIERGHLGLHSIDTIRAVAAALEIRVDLVARWRAGDLDRLLNSRHSALHESVARSFLTTYPAWIIAAEVSFAIYGDRGVIDILAWHPGRRALLVIELKTDIADVNELLGTLDRKRRVAPAVGKGRGWDPVTVSTWLIVAASRTNRRRIEAHGSMVRGALPNRMTRRWLRDPVGRLDGLSFWAAEPAAAAERSARVTVRRVRAGPTRAEPQ